MADIRAVLLISGDAGAVTGVYVCLTSGVGPGLDDGNLESGSGPRICGRGDCPPASGEVAALRALYGPAPIPAPTPPPPGLPPPGLIRPIKEVEGIPSPSPSLAIGAGEGEERCTPAPSTKKVIGTGPLEANKLPSVFPTRVGIRA